MKINRRVAETLACKAWGIDLKELKQQAQDGDIRLQDLMTAAMVEIATHPLSAEALTEMLLPGRSEDKRKKKHQNIMDGTVAQLLQLKQAAEQKPKAKPDPVPQTEAETPKADPGKDTKKTIKIKKR